MASLVYGHWKQPAMLLKMVYYVVISFQISIFEPLETTPDGEVMIKEEL